MVNNLNFGIQFQVNGDKNVITTVNKINDSFNKINQSIGAVNNSIVNSFGNITNSIKNINFSNQLEPYNRVATGFENITEPGLKLSSAMADLSAITGITGAKLKEIEGYARENAKAFGGSAAEGVESFKLVLSKLSPEIAKQPQALKAMGESISVLSKTMGGDTVAAAEVLTTAMNQYGVSVDDPMNASKEMAVMMNVMAAAAKVGSAELPQIKSALEQVGGVAKAVGVSFSETNAAIQLLDKAGKQGAEGGVALRNVMTTLSEGRFLPKDVQREFLKAGIDVNALGDKSKSLSDRLNLLKPIVGDTALLTKLFGRENILAGQALINGTGVITEYNTAIQGTNTAYEQAAIIMESPAEKSARLQQKIEDLKIGFFNMTGGALGYITVASDLTRTITDLAPAFTGAVELVKWLGDTQAWTAIKTTAITIATSLWTGAQWLLNAAFWANPLTWVILAIVALIAVIAWVVSSTTGWGEAWQHVVNGSKLIFEAFVEYAKWLFNTLVDGIMIGLNYIMLGWYKFKNVLGLGDRAENDQAIDAINANTEQRVKAIKEGRDKWQKPFMQAEQEYGAAINSLRRENDETTPAATAAPNDLTTTPAFGGAALKDNSLIKKLIPNNPLGGIAPANSPAGGDSTQTDTTKKNTKDTTQTSNNISAGGTKSTIININIKDIIGIQHFAGTLKEGVNTIKTQVEEGLIRAVAAAATTAG